MKSRMMYFPLFCLLAGSCLFSAPARAQNGSGWQVMKADWGAGNRWMDVTNQVRRLLNGNGRVLVNNDTMGGDPAYGVIKTLRIRAQNSRGQTQQFTYREGDTIDARQYNNNGPLRGIPDIDHHRVPVVPVMAITALCKLRARTMA